MESPGALLQALYKELKKQNRNFSLQFISDKAQLPSKGYLGDVFSGRRRLNAKYAQDVATVFGLKGLDKKIFLLMVSLEHEASGVKQSLLRKRLNALAAQLRGAFTQLPEKRGSRLLVSRVYCALGIFPKAPTRQNIVKLFPDTSAEDIQSTIGALITQNLVKESDGLLSYSSREVIFDSGENNKAQAHLSYLQESLDFAKQALPRWAPQPRASYFESCVVSVNLQKYQEALPRIREFFDLLQSELEVAHGADDLAYFNIQVFPESGGKMGESR